MDSTVIATVDAGRSNLVVWWTNVRADRTSSFARNCGAWDLRKSELESIETLTSGKVCLVTPTARKFLDTAFDSNRRYLDGPATLAGVLAERERLDDAHQAGKTGAAAKPLPLSMQPEPIDLIKAKDLNAPKPVQRAIAISRWLVLVSDYWESIEAARLSRPALRKLGDGGLRELPLILHSTDPKKERPARARRARVSTNADALRLPFDGFEAG